MRDSYELEVLLKMTAKEWLDKNNCLGYISKEEIASPQFDQT